MLTTEMIKGHLKLVGPSEDYAFVTETPEYQAFLEGYVSLANAMDPNMTLDEVRKAVLVLHHTLAAFEDAMDDLGPPPSA